MTINEFRAWLDGFREAVGEAPTPEQWAKVLAKLQDVREATFPPSPLNPWGTLPTPRFGEITCRNLDQLNAPGTRVYVNGQDVGPSD
jgi:hypothetical protein